MAEIANLPGTSAGDELRLIIAARRRRLARARLFAAMGLAAIPVVASLLWKPPVLLVWNSSASAPVGLYTVQPGSPVRRGDMVVAWTPDSARPLAAARHYLPANVPLVKRVAASEGDRVCAAGADVRINGARVATRLRRDSSGRPMPWWNGCSTLGPGQHLLLMDSRSSFDGRYFGITRAGDMLGKAELLWAKRAKGSKAA